MKFSLGSLTQHLHTDTFERAGFVSIDPKTNHVVFVQTNTGKTNEYGRKYVHISTNKFVKWHSHPYTEGFWPSFEDLSDLYTKGISLIITIRGMWIINGEVSKNKIKINHESLQFIWRPFHKMLTDTTQKNWQHAPSAIRKFTTTINRNQGDLRFIHNGWIMNGEPYNYVSNCEQFLRAFL